MDTEIIKKCLELYKNEEYKEFFQLGSFVYKQMINSNNHIEFIYQALTNVAYMFKLYDSALSVSEQCLKNPKFYTEDNLSNRLKIFNKLDDNNLHVKKEKRKLLLELFKVSKEENYLYNYIDYSLQNIENVPELLEVIQDLGLNKQVFYKISSYIILCDTFVYLKYGKLFTNKIFKDVKDSELFERIEKTEWVEEQTFCILHLILPSLFYKKNRIDKEYKRILTNLRKLVEIKNIKKVEIENIQKFFKNNYTYYYTYFGENIKEILELYTRLSIKICPYLFYQVKKIEKSNKIRIGFISNFIFKNHSVSKDRLGIFKHLCMDKDYEVYLIHFDAKKEKEVIFEKIMGDVKYNEILLKNSIKENYEIIEKLQLDILVFPEIGMDMDIYLMSYSKLAPIQINTWGHSDTSGMKTIDYYFSSEYFETENGQQNYSEKLIKLKSLSTYYYDNSMLFDKFDENEKTKIKYQLYENYHLYGIFQTVFKYHPELMDMIRSILVKDPKAFFIIFISKACWKEFMEYAYDFFGFNCSRIKLIESIPNLPYCNLLKSMDILIDSYPFGGCNTSLDSFFFNKIVLTIPTNKLNGRFTYGFYKKMDILDPVCDSPDDLVNKAIYYMENKKERKELEELISKRKYRVFREKESLMDWNNQVRKLLKFPLRKEKSRKIVLSRYKENIDYVDYYFPNENVLVYNKGNNELKVENKNIKNLENVGKCDHTYLYHIIENYEKLDDITVFLPASFFHIDKKKSFVKKMFEYINMINNEKSCFIGEYNENIIQNNYNFFLESYDTVFKDNIDESVSTDTQLSQQRPFGKWVEHIFGDTKSDYMNQYGIMAITKEDILKHPVEFYKKIFEYVQTPNPEAGHFIERSYSLMFPHEKEQFIEI